MYFTGTEINEEMNRLYFGGKKLPFNSYNRLFSTHLSRLALHRFMHVVTVSIIFPPRTLFGKVLNSAFLGPFRLQC